MTHRHIIELAAHLTEHGPTILSRCRGIPVLALQSYLKARKKQYQQWSDKLTLSAPTRDRIGIDDTPATWQEVRPVLEEVASAAILIRVASTLLHGIGEQLDIPLAIDVAGQSARAFDIVVQRAMAFIAAHDDLDGPELVTLDRLGQVADRMSDLLCGALLPTLKCERYAVDRGRAEDFAHTFGRDPGLVRVPVQQAAKRLPGNLHFIDSAREVDQALTACLTIPDGVAKKGTKRPLEAPELRLVAANKPYRTATDGQIAGGQTADLPIPFPTISFVRSRRHLKGSALE